MTWFRRAMYVLVLLPSIALASENPLGEVGRLLLTGRAGEARPQLVALRDTFAAENKKPEEAAAWLLLGMVDVSLGDRVGGPANMRAAAGKFQALGDHFGAWFSLWTVAMFEARDGTTAAATQAYEELFTELKLADSPGAGFSLGSIEMLGAAFGANTEMLAPFASHPEIVKPIMLRFANTISHDSFAALLLETSELERAEEELRQASEAAALFGGALDGDINLHYAKLRQQQWRLDEAREYYMKALQHSQTIGPMFMPPAVASDPWLELNVLRNLAELELLRGRLDDALVWNDRALKLVREKSDAKREAGVLRNRAGLLENGGRYDAAFATYGDALNLAVRTSSLDLQASIHSDLGMAHMVAGAYGTAATHLEKAIALYQTLRQPYVEAAVWLQLTEVYMLLEANPSVENALENARKLAEKSDFKLAREMVDVLTTARKAMKGRASAKEVEAALQGFMSDPEAKSLMPAPGVADVLHDSFLATLGVSVEPRNAIERGAPPIINAFSAMLRARLALQRHEYEKARRYCNDALALNPNREHKAGLFALIGATYWAEGNGEEAIRFFRKAAEGLDAVASDVKVEELLTTFLGGDRRIYFDVLIEMLVAEGHPMDAFAQAEKARARAFLQVVGNHRLQAAAGADPSLVAEAENVRAVIASREKDLTSATPEDAVRIAGDLARAREHYKTVVIRMKTTNPEYADLATVAPRAIETIGSDLPADTTLVSYYVSAHAVHAWIVDRESMHYELLRLDGAALRPITCWAEKLGSTESRGMGVPGADCGNTATPEDAYRALFAPLRKHIRHDRLVLVPHGVLHYIPFAALRDPDTKHYLVQDYKLIFTPSASALHFLREKETPVNGGALVLGDPVTPLRGLEPLPGAKQEAAFVASALGTTPHLGADARESLFYTLNGKYDLIHVAAHAIYDAADPLFSRIALAAGDQQDGSLTVNDILSAVDLKGVNLVVLSACRSAVGQRSGGDEIVGLTRALLYAGTPGVISTLWNISDSAAATLMNDFYGQVTKGFAVADALRYAQLAAIESKDRSDPRYWAAFMLTGDPQGRWRIAVEKPPEAK
jgi:tetratricopeptide (TPR) repeat protein